MSAWQFTPAKSCTGREDRGRGHCVVLSRGAFSVPVTFELVRSYPPLRRPGCCSYVHHLLFQVLIERPRWKVGRTAEVAGWWQPASLWLSQLIGDQQLQVTTAVPDRMLCRWYYQYSDKPDKRQRLPAFTLHQAMMWSVYFKKFSEVIVYVWPSSKKGHTVHTKTQSLRIPPHEIAGF